MGYIFPRFQGMLITKLVIFQGEGLQTSYPPLDPAWHCDIILSQHKIKQVPFQFAPNQGSDQLRIPSLNTQKVPNTTGHIRTNPIAADTGDRTFDLPLPKLMPYPLCYRDRYKK